MQNNQEPLVGGVIGKEYLAFTLGDEEYGIDILAVREIRSYEAVTKIANSPEFIKSPPSITFIIGRLNFLANSKSRSS